MAIHICTVCGKEENGTDSWMWFGSWADLDDGNPILLICSESCKTTACAQGLVGYEKQRQPSIDKKVLAQKRTDRAAEKEARERAEWERLSKKFALATK